MAAPIPSGPRYPDSISNKRQLAIGLTGSSTDLRRIKRQCPEDLSSAASSATHAPASPGSKGVEQTMKSLSGCTYLQAARDWQ